MTLHTLKKTTESFVQIGMILFTLHTNKALATTINPSMKEFNSIETPVVNKFLEEKSLSLADSLLPKERKTLYNLFETLPIDTVSRSIDITKLPETLILNLPKGAYVTLQSIRGNRVTALTNIPINMDDNIWRDSTNTHLRGIFTPKAELNPTKKEMTITGTKHNKPIISRHGKNYYDPTAPLHYTIGIPENITVVIFNGETYAIGEAFKKDKDGIQLNSSHSAGGYTDKVATENTKETMTYTLRGNRETNDHISNTTQELREKSNKTDCNENPILIEGEKIYLYQDILKSITDDASLSVSTKIEMIKHFGNEYKKNQKAKRSEKLSQATERGSLQDEVIDISTLSNGNILNLDGLSGSILKSNYDIIIKDFQTGVLTQKEAHGIIKVLGDKNKEFK